MKTQSKEWFLNEAIHLKVYTHPNFQHLLQCGKGEYFGKTEKYLFKTIPSWGQVDWEEIRFHLKSGRVTISKYETK